MQAGRQRSNGELNRVTSGGRNSIEERRVWTNTKNAWTIDARRGSRFWRAYFRRIGGERAKQRTKEKRTEERAERHQTQGVNRSGEGAEIHRVTLRLTSQCVKGTYV